MLSILFICICGCASDPVVVEDKKIWTQLKCSSYQDVIHFAKNGNDIYMVDSYKNRFYLSKDNGETSIELKCPENITAMSNIQNYIYVTTTTGVYVSDNQGYTWQKKNTGLGKDTSITAIHIKDDIITIGSGLGGIYQSKDYGNTWVVKNILQLNSDFVTSVTVDLLGYIYASFYDGTIMRISPKSILDYKIIKKTDDLGFPTQITNYGSGINTTYIVTGRGVYFPNGDNSWDYKQVVTDGKIHSPKFIILYANKTIVGCSDGIYTTHDSGVTWIDNSDEKNVYSCTSMFIEDPYIYVGTQFKGIFKAKYLDLK